ncbi:hypothetical protein V6N12_066876 [Hibiscus sabdariffa]|uniref:Uncharacterized protein n=1 Tax=Hibiscus sabdariffa TaxID=183260 RepID=A0ABR2CBC9_9ROSI
MSWHYQPSYEHSNPLEQTFPTFTTSFDRLLEEMQNLNKSMEARLVKMDERMINWGGSTSVVDNMPKGTEIPRQEALRQAAMPRQHPRMLRKPRSSPSRQQTGSIEAARPDSTESICPGSKLTFCSSGEQNDCFDGNCLSDKITDCLENEAQSMVIPPTICVAPKSLLMEMLKKSEDNDTWKLDDFKKYVPSIDFHRILAKDCHDNWVEQQLPQQRRLHQTMMEVKANKVIKWLNVITIFPNPIFMPSGTIARWSVYMNFKGKRNKDISIVAVQKEVAEIPLAQVFLGRIVTRWRVQMDTRSIGNGLPSLIRDQLTSF